MAVALKSRKDSGWSSLFTRIGWEITGRRVVAETCICIGATAPIGSEDGPAIGNYHLAVAMYLSITRDRVRGVGRPVFLFHPNLNNNALAAR